MKRVIILLPISLFLLLALVFAAVLRGHDETLPSALIGKPLPEFSLPSPFESEPGIDSKTLKGNYTLINIFASWCVSCRAEHHLLMQLAEKKIVPIYGLNWKDKDDKAKAWLAELGNPYTAIGADREGDVAIMLGITGAPETFLIDKGGNIIYRFAGVLTEQIIADEIIARVTQQ